jgi:peroxiredoxin
MMRTPVITLMCVWLAALALAGCTAPPASLPDHDGLVHTPLDGDEGDLVVVVFSSTDCPIANAMAPDIERASRETTEAGGRFYLVHARPELTSERTHTHAREYELTMPVIVDRDHDLVRTLDATVTPEAFLLRMRGNGRYDILYHGSVNNLYGSVGNRRQNISEHHLRDAVRTAAAGDEIEVSERVPFGCYIERN